MTKRGCLKWFLGVFAFILVAVWTPVVVRGFRAWFPEKPPAPLQGLVWDEVNAEAIEHLRMNQIQTVGTHNSYHVRTRNPIAQFLQTYIPLFQGWDYAHAPLDIQLDRGLRNLELDVYHNPRGLRVLHVPFFDAASSCDTFEGCLRIVKGWSDRHPKHAPIILLTEIKSNRISWLKFAPFQGLDVNQLDREIRSVFGPDQLITPDDVRGNSPTLSEAVTTKGWPELRWARGRVMLVMHARGDPADAYIKDHPSLEGRAMFLESQKGKPFASFFVRNTPDNPEIAELARQGYMVRTRADAGVKRMLNGGEQRADNRPVAFASGAHVISTDFPPGEAAPTTGYFVELPGGVPVRPNPVTAPQ